MTSLSFDERVGLLVDAEHLSRDNRKLARRLKEAKLRIPQACLEDLDYAPRRELDRALIRQLATGRWIGEHRNVLILDDWGLAAVNDVQRQDLLEVMEDRDATRSTIITSQLPRDQWHAYLGDPTIADAVLDRLVHNAFPITLKGPSRRKGTAASR